MAHHVYPTPSPPINMNWAATALPATILAVKFLLKLFVDRSATSADVVSAILALPVDIVFLAASLVAGYAISEPSRAGHGLILFTSSIGVSVLVVVLWRRCDKLFVADRLWSTSLLATLNFVICGTALVAAVQLLTPSLP